MRRTLFLSLIALTLVMGIANNVEAQSLAGVVAIENGTCTISSLRATKGTSTLSATMAISCSGRFGAGNVTSTLYFDPTYPYPSMVYNFLGEVNKTLAVRYYAPGRNLCNTDFTSSLKFCDASPVSTSAPYVLSCLKDGLSGKIYCPSWNSIGATTSTGATTNLAAQVSMNPVGQPTTAGGAFDAVPSSTVMSTSATSTKCARAIGKVFWYASGQQKSTMLVVKPTGC